MPEQGKRVFGEYTFRLSKVVEAPARYVYEWCTDFRADDGKFSRRKPRFRVIRIAPNRLVRIRQSPAGSKPASLAVEAIRLRPPNAWHLDQIDESDLEAVDYRVRRLGPRRSRLTVDITERWMVPKFPTRRQCQASSGAFWDQLVAAIEQRYRSGRPAKG
jgi:hypothetical protein